jgi:DNA invertase Pin-like site-specific DNA recombinase
MQNENSKPMKVAIYARVSKERCPREGCGHLYAEHPSSGACTHPRCKCSEYGGQDPENQLIELRRYAIAQKWEIVEYIDRATGKNSDREALQEIFRDASQRKFDVLLVWALDRLSREGVWETFEHIRRLRQHGVEFESYTESHFRTTGPAGELMIAIAAWIAKQERIRISDRTKAGLARARNKGRIGGRPAQVWDRERAQSWRNESPPRSWRWISRELGIAQSSIRAVLDPRVRKPSSGVHKTSPKKREKRAPSKS